MNSSSPYFSPRSSTRKERQKRERRVRIDAFAFFVAEDREYAIGQENFLEAGKRHTGR